MKWLTFKKSGRRISVFTYCSFKCWNVHPPVDWRSGVWGWSVLRDLLCHLRLSAPSLPAEASSPPGHTVSPVWGSDTWQWLLGDFRCRVGPSDRLDIPAWQCVLHLPGPLDENKWWNCIVWCRIFAHRTCCLLFNGERFYQMLLWHPAILVSFLKFAI